MKKSSSFVLLILFCLIPVSLFTGCIYPESDKYSEENEIKVNIQLDLNEDIGLLLTEWDINGQQGMSGASNADKSMIKRNDITEWSLDKEFLNSPADTVEVKLKFIVVTEFFEPDYGFDYPDEYEIPTDEISFTAAFGGTYSVTISGGKESGYRAILNNQ